MVRRAEKRIPVFRTIAEEAAFWDTHDFTDYEDGFHPVEFGFAVATPSRQVANPRFETFLESTGRYRWLLVAANGHLVASSEASYATRASARRAAEVARAAAGAAEIAARP